MMRFGDLDLRLPGWGVLGSAMKDRGRRPTLSGEPGGPLSADVSFESIGGLDLRVARWRLDKPSEHPPVLFFNGIGANIEAVAPLAEALEERGFIMFDMPGTGESPDPVFPYTPSTMSWTARGILERFGLDEVDVMGMSWGGTIAQQFALQHGSRVRRVVLAATTPGMMMIPGDPKMLAQMADPYSAINEMLMREYMSAMENADESRLARNSVGNISPPSATGYFYQLLAMLGWIFKIPMFSGDGILPATSSALIVCPLVFLINILVSKAMQDKLDKESSRRGDNILRKMHNLPGYIEEQQAPGKSATAY